jgi:hypothetical protein
MFTLRTGPAISRHYSSFALGEIVEKRVPCLAILTNNEQVPLSRFQFGKGGHPITSENREWSLAARVRRLRRYVRSGGKMFLIADFYLV